MNAARRNFIETHKAFIEAVRSMSPPIEGLVVENDLVVVLSTSKLYAKGVRIISGFSKCDGSCYDIAFRDERDDLLSYEQAMNAGLDGQNQTLDASELNDFLVKLVNQTQ